MKRTIITLSFLIGLAYGQQKDTVYELKGVKKNFEFLLFAIKNPRDVTPNQQDAIIKWIEGIKPSTDTIKVKK